MSDELEEVIASIERQTADRCVVGEFGWKKPRRCPPGTFGELTLARQFQICDGQFRWTTPESVRADEGCVGSPREPPGG